MSMISEIMTYGGDLPKKLSAITGKQVKPWNLTEEQWSAEENKTRLAPMWGILDNMYR